MGTSKAGWAPISTWPSRLAKHIVSGGRGWIWFAAVCFVLMTPFIVELAFVEKYQQVALRVSGMLLQLIGFLMALLGIEGSLRLAGAPTVARAFLAFLKGFLSALRVNSHIITGEGASLAISTARAQNSTEPSPDATIDQRLVHLERNVKVLQNTVWEHGDKFSQLEKSISEETAKLRDELNSQTEAVRDYVNQFQVGSAFYEFVGIVFFAFGVIYSTVPEFIQRWFGSFEQFGAVS